MALEGTYEYECMRAELLGIEKPDYEEFMKNKAEKEAVQAAELEAEAAREFKDQKDYFGRTSGKLDELGNILKSTQKRINNITAPFSSYFKTKIGLKGSASCSKDNESLSVDQAELESNQKAHAVPEDEEHNYSTDVKDPLTSEGKNKDFTLDHTPLIDNLIDKSETQLLGMQHQIKQMKRFK